MTRRLSSSHGTIGTEALSVLSGRYDLDTDSTELCVFRLEIIPSQSASCRIRDRC